MTRYGALGRPALREHQPNWTPRNRSHKEGSCSAQHALLRPASSLPPSFLPSVRSFVRPSVLSAHLRLSAPTPVEPSLWPDPPPLNPLQALSGGRRAEGERRAPRGRPEAAGPGLSPAGRGSGARGALTARAGDRGASSGGRAATAVRSRGEGSPAAAPPPRAARAGHGDNRGTANRRAPCPPLAHRGRPRRRERAPRAPSRTNRRAPGEGARPPRARWQLLSPLPGSRPEPKAGSQSGRRKKSVRRAGPRAELPIKGGAGSERAAHLPLALPAEGRSRGEGARARELSRPPARPLFAPTAAAPPPRRRRPPASRDEDQVL